MNLNFEKYEESFLNEVKANWKNSTYQSRKYLVNNFVDYFKTKGWDMNTSEIREFIKNIEIYFKDSDGLEPTQSGIAALKHFLEYIGEQEDEITQKEIKIINAYLKKSNLREPTTKDQESILSTNDISKALSEANDFEELVIRVLYDSGANPGEISVLRRRDVNLNSLKNPALLTINKTHSQGADDSIEKLEYEKHTPITENTKQLLESYLEQNNLEQDDRIFFNTKNAYRKLYDLVKDVFTVAEVKMEEGGTTVVPSDIRKARHHRWKQDENISNQEIRKIVKESDIISGNYQKPQKESEIPKIY